MDVKRLRGWTAAAVGVWGLAVVGVAAQAYCRTNDHTMFDIYAGAAHDWWAGADMYELHREWYRYSPLFAVAMTPLAALPEGAGNALWKAANAAVFLAGLAAWLRSALPVPPTRAVAGAAVLLTLPGAMHSLHVGQANLLMMGLILFGLTAAAGGRWWAAAGLVAGATLVKGYPIALGLLLSALFPRVFAWRFAVLFGAGLALPFLFQSPEAVAGQYESWAKHLVLSQGDINRERQRAVDNLLEVAGLPVPPSGFLLMGAAAGAAVLGLCLRDARRTPDLRDRLLRVGMLFAMWVVLFGPATETCTHVVFAPFAAWLLADAVGRRAGWAECGVLTAGLMMSGPAATDLFGSGVRRFTNANGVQQIGELVLLAYLFTRARGFAPGDSDPTNPPPVNPGNAVAANPDGGVPVGAIA